MEQIISARELGLIIWEILTFILLIVLHQKTQLTSGCSPLVALTGNSLHPVEEFVVAELELS